MKKLVCVLLACVLISSEASAATRERSAMWLLPFEFNQGPLSGTSSKIRLDVATLGDRNQHIICLSFGTFELEPGVCNEYGAISRIASVSTEISGRVFSTDDFLGPSASLVLRTSYDQVTQLSAISTGPDTLKIDFRFPRFSGFDLLPGKIEYFSSMGKSEGSFKKVSLDGFTPVPLPAGWLALGSGLIAIGLMARGRSKDVI